MDFKTWFAIGAAIMVVGFIIQWYPASVIGGFEVRLTYSGLPTAERDLLQSNIHWWTVYQITTYNPIGNILIVVGIIIIIYSVISNIFLLASKQASK